jgi:hypothetical protein
MVLVADLLFAEIAFGDGHTVGLMKWL